MSGINSAGGYVERFRDWVTAEDLRRKAIEVLEDPDKASRLIDLGAINHISPSMSADEAEAKRSSLLRLEESQHWNRYRRTFAVRVGGVAMLAGGMVATAAIAYTYYFIKDGPDGNSDISSMKP